MDWSQSQIPPMRLEARFGDRVVPAFSDRPANLWAMIADACARNPQGEALIAGSVVFIMNPILTHATARAARVQDRGYWQEEDPSS